MDMEEEAPIAPAAGAPAPNTTVVEGDGSSGDGLRAPMSVTSEVPRAQEKRMSKTAELFESLRSTAIGKDISEDDSLQPGLSSNRTPLPLMDPPGVGGDPLDSQERAPGQGRDSAVFQHLNQTVFGSNAPRGRKYSWRDQTIFSVNFSQLEAVLGEVGDALQDHEAQIQRPPWLPALTERLNQMEHMQSCLQRDLQACEGRQIEMIRRLDIMQTRIRMGGQQEEGEVSGDESRRPSRDIPASREDLLMTLKKELGITHEDSRAMVRSGEHLCAKQP
jgi:hypothetical protein